MATDAVKALVRSTVAEFLGTVIFVYVGCMQAASLGGVLVAALAHGLAIAVLIAGLAHVSGGHFNPAVSLGVLLSGNLPVVNALFYMAAQLLGGLVGALLARATMTDVVYEFAVGATTRPAAQYGVGQVLICEVMLTYFLVHTVLNTAVDTDSNLLAPLMIGLSITVDILAGGAVSGASMNPARSLGPAIVYQLFGGGLDIWTYHYIYYAGPAIGSALAALVYKAFLAKDGSRWIL